MRDKISLLTAVFTVLVLTLAPNLWASSAEKTIYNFSVPDGAGPSDGMVLDPAGNLYGTTAGGGAYDSGTVFELMPTFGGWSETVLHSFAGAPGDGYSPYACVVFDGAGNLYGTTERGGMYGAGIVFKLTPGANRWSETVLYNFTGGPDGGYPVGRVLFDAKGNMYGTTTYGGNVSACNGGCGVVFELSPTKNVSWTYGRLYAFDGTSGQFPASGLTLHDGKLYGTTAFGGRVTVGVVFRLSPTHSGWKETVLHNFRDPPDGAFPAGSLAFDRQGNLYGTTQEGGTYGGGTVFGMVHAVDKEYGVLYSFRELVQGFPQDPANTLILDRSGDLFGVVGGSKVQAGAVFELVKKPHGKWTHRTVYNFTGGRNGEFPSGIVLDGNGSIFGTTAVGGTSDSCEQGCGLAFEITP
jgi:uncharacterized repeat protein (TIGR03803 family)